MTPAASTSHTPRTMDPFVVLVKSEYVVLLLSLLYLLAFAPFTPGFASSSNLETLFLALLPFFIVAMGETFVLIGGGIDLSVTSTMALTSVVGAMAMNSTNGWLAGHPLAAPAGLLLILLLGGALGWLNGAAITWFRMPPFIVTLTAMMFYNGFALWLTKAETISNLPPAFNALGGKTWVALLITAGLALTAHLMLSRSLYGRWLYAVGHNPRTSLVSGVPVNGVVIATYVVSGILAAAAAALYTGQTETGNPNLGKDLLLDIIGATVIGGTSLFGGKGRIFGTLWGVLFLKLIDNTLGLLNFSYVNIIMAKGGFIFVAALLDAWKNRTGPTR